MKKTIYTLALLFFYFNNNAQELKSKKGENYLPEKGDLAIGFNADNLFKYIGNFFSSSGTNSIGTFSNNGWNGTFVGKKFISDKIAYRCIAGLGINTNTSNAAFGVGGNDEKVSNGFNVALGIGKEWRKGKTRLQGFYGGDFVLGFGTSSEKHTYTDAGGKSLGSNEVKNGAKFDIGARGFLGAEYFIFPKMSMGAQYSYNLMFGIVGDNTITITDASGKSTDTKSKGSSNLNIGDISVGSINVTLHF